MEDNTCEILSITFNDGDEKAGSIEYIAVECIVNHKYYTFRFPGFELYSLRYYMFSNRIEIIAELDHSYWIVATYTPSLFCTHEEKYKTAEEYYNLAVHLKAKIIPLLRKRKKTIKSLAEVCENNFKI